MNITRLDAIPLFAQLRDTDRAAIAPVLREAVADAEQLLAHEGDFTYELMAIEEGEAQLYRGGVLVSRLCPGDVVGEIGALERRMRATTIVAATPMRLLTLSALELQRLRHSQPAAVARLQAALLLRRRALATSC